MSAEDAERQRSYAPQPRRITQVVLVGAATRMPAVRALVRNITGIEPATHVDPEHCVALGAAVRAGMLLGQVEGVELADGAYALDLQGRSSGFQTMQLYEN